jgi:hypothetical protein
MQSLGAESRAFWGQKGGNNAKEGLAQTFGTGAVGRAGRGQILISERTYQQAQDIIEARSLEPIKVKGKEEPVVVYEILGLSS